MSVFDRYVGFFTKHRWVLLIIFITVCIIAIVGTTRVSFDPELAIVLDTPTEARVAYEDMLDSFDTGDQLIYVVELDTAELSKADMKLLREIQSKLETLDGISAVIGPAPAEASFGPTRIDFRELDAGSFEQYMQFLDIMGDISPVQLKNGQVFGVFNLFLEKSHSPTQTIPEIRSVFEDTGLQFWGGGEGYVEYSLIQHLVTMLIIIPPLALVLVILVFRLQLGTFGLAILSVIPAGLGALWIVGIMGWAGRELSILTVLAPILTVVMGSADGLHFMSHFRDFRGKSGPKDALGTTLREVGIPMILTTVTTIAAFMSLMMTGYGPMRELAVFSSLGIALAAVVTWWLLPVILLESKEFRVKRSITQGFIDNAVKKLWGRLSLGLLGVVVIAGIVGLPRLEVEFDQLDLFKERTEIRQDFDMIQHVSGGAIPVFVTVETDYSVLDQRVAIRSMQLERELAELNLASLTLSPYGIIARGNMLLGNLDSPKYPETAFQTALVHTSLTRVAGSSLEFVIRPGDQLARLVLFPADLRGNTLDEISDVVEAKSDDDVRFSAVGTSYMIKEMNDRVFGDQISSILWAVIFVLVILFLVFKRAKIALVGLVPIGLTLIMQFSFMGILNIPLNIITATMASITIGVGIDYSIHFISLYRLRLIEGKTVKEAVDSAYSSASRPIISNALGLSVGLSSLLVSPLQLHTYVSQIMWVTMITSSVLALAILPTVLLKGIPYAKRLLKQR